MLSCFIILLLISSFSLSPICTGVIYTILLLSSLVCSPNFHYNFIMEAKGVSSLEFLFRSPTWMWEVTNMKMKNGDLVPTFGDFTLNLNTILKSSNIGDVLWDVSTSWGRGQPCIVLWKCVCVLWILAPPLCCREPFKNQALTKATRQARSQVSTHTLSCIIITQVSHQTKRQFKFNLLMD